MNIFLNRNISILLSGQLISQVGDKFYMLALSFWVLETTGSPAKMGLVLACSLMPSLILGFFTGVFIDRYNKKTIIVLTDIIRGAVILILTFFYLRNALNMTLVLTGQILLSINSAFFDPAIPSLIPQIVEKENLSRANSMTQFVRGISSIAGPVLGGMAVAGFGYTPVFFFNALSFFISAFFESFMTIDGPAGCAGRKEFRIRQDIAEGFCYMSRNTGFLIILFMVAAIHFFVGSIEVIIPVLSTKLIGHGARNIGLIQAAFGGGMVCMALIVGLFSLKNREVQYLFGSVFCVGIIFVLISLLKKSHFMSVFTYLPLFLTWGIFIVVAGTSFQTIIQKKTSESMRGRVFGVVSSVGNGTIPLAMICYGNFMGRFSISDLLLVTGIILLPLSLFSYIKYRRIADEDPKEVRTTEACSG